MSGALRKLAQLAYRFAPKWNHAVIWGWPDYEDSAIALEQALQSSKVRRVVLLMTDTDAQPPWEIGSRTIRVRKNSPAGWLWFCFAKYVFFTHPCFTRNFPPTVVSINVWHGMPIKKIGRMIEGDPEIHSRHVLATSPFWGEIMQRAMSPTSEILTVGLPRNDRLFSDRRAVMEKLGIPENRRLLAWLPTYRTSVRGLPRTDGVESGNVFEMRDVDPDELNGFLASRNAMMLVKPHPMAASGNAGSWSNLHMVDNAWLNKRSLSLYEFLGATDILISDISSVVIDYLLLDRPVIHAFDDLVEYQTSRGFTVYPIESYFVGPVVTNSQELYATLDRHLAGDDPMAHQRREISCLSHTHRDAGATRRLLESIHLTR